MEDSDSEKCERRSVSGAAAALAADPGLFRRLRAAAMTAHRASDYAPIGDYASSSPRQRPGSSSSLYTIRESGRKDRKRSPIVPMMASCLVAAALLASVFDEPMTLKDELKVIYSILPYSQAEPRCSNPVLAARMLPTSP
jgi:hypothetical protein